MLSTTVRAARPKDRSVIESRAAPTHGDKTDRQSTYLALAIAAVLASAALAYVYLRRPSSSLAIALAAIAGLITILVQSINELRTYATAAAAKRDRAARDAEGRIVVIRCQATAMVLIEGDDSDYPVYVFQVEPDRMLLVSGELVVATPGFPSTAFELTHTEDDPADLLELTVMGGPIAPVRVIPASARASLASVDDQALLDGRLENLELVLSGDK